MIWLILGALLLVVLNLPDSLSGRFKAALREGVAPLQDLTADVSRNVREAGRSLRGLSDAALENRRLNAEVARLRTEVQRLNVFEREHADLRRQLHYASTRERRLVAAEVIARDISGWWQAIRVNKGALNGVRPQRAVITSDGLIGRTDDVSMHTSDVLLLSDPGCKVSAEIGRSGAFGLLTGRGVSWNGLVILRMDFINKNMEVRPGDEVVTSGLGGVYPKGLVIGYIEQVYRDRQGLFQRADVVPRADFGSLSQVFVVLNEQDPVEDLYLRRRFEEGPGEVPEDGSETPSADDPAGEVSP